MHNFGKFEGNRTIINIVLEGQNFVFHANLLHSKACISSSSSELICAAQLKFGNIKENFEFLPMYE